MENLLKNITREPADTTISDIISTVAEGQDVCIVFPAVKTKEESKPTRISGESMRRGHEYIVRVANWMTEKATEYSPFMKQWNANVPMPFVVMRGRVLSEARSMLYMELRACTLRTDNCMRCGKPLTHPVSKLYGLGPECGQHYHINPFNTEEELSRAIQEIREKLSAITWTGWIPKFGVMYAVEVLPRDSSSSK